MKVPVAVVLPGGPLWVAQHKVQDLGSFGDLYAAPPPVPVLWQAKLLSLEQRKST